jgi:hypothetical protein
MPAYLQNRISLLVKELVLMQGEPASCCSSRLDHIFRFVLEQMERMPWFLRLAMQGMTLLFSATCALRGGLFSERRSEAVFRSQLDTWRRSSFRPCRDFVKFYTALVVLSIYSVGDIAGNEVSR